MSVKKLFKKYPCRHIRVTSFYGKRNIVFKGASRNHKGIDIGPYKRGTSEKLKAVADFTVKKNYYNIMRGWTLVLELGNGYEILYQHLSKKSHLKKGRKGKAGEVVGIMGSTGSSSGVHLHMELSDQGHNTDPLPYIIKSYKSVNVIHDISVKNKSYVLEVKRLQENLRKMGYYKGKIDGIPGKLTESAVKMFQRKYRLKVDGYFGAKCREKYRALGYK